MRLASSVRIKGGKPTIPFPFGCFGFLEIANDWKLFRREESIVYDSIVLPAVGGASHIVIWLSFQPSAVIEIQMRSLDIVELEAVLLKDTSDATSLHPKQSCKEEVKASTHDSNQGRAAIGHVGWRKRRESGCEGTLPNKHTRLLTRTPTTKRLTWMIPDDERAERRHRKGQKVVWLQHDVFHHGTLQRRDVASSDRCGLLARNVGRVAGPVVGEKALFCGRRRQLGHRRRRRS